MAKEPDYKVDYNDTQLKKVESEKSAAIKESDKMYDSMIGQSDSFYNKQIDAVEQYGETQAKNQQEQTDFAIEQIQQQKDQAQKDYVKEQTGAYVDWQKQSDQYGSNAEQMAASGLAHTGYSESSQVAMYNAYQNRVATAREVYNKAVLNYDNAIKDAQLQNNSLLAEIAYNTLQTSLELGLQSMQYKNTLLQTKADAKRDIDNTYYSRYQDRINQINTENAMAEQVRQYNQSHQLEIDKFKEDQRQYNKSFKENQRQYNTSLKEQQRQFNKNYKLDVKEYNLKVKQYNESIRQFDVEIKRLKAQDKKDNAYKIKQLELQRDQLKEEKRQFDKNYELQKKNLTSGSSSNGNGGNDDDDGGYYPIPEEEPETEPESKKNVVSNKTKLSLGKGPVSDNYIKKLVSEGKVEVTKVNGKDTLQNKKLDLPLPAGSKSTNAIIELMKKKK